METSNRRNLVKMDPPELRFPFESNLHISCSVEISNITDDHIAFQFQCPRTKKFSFLPKQGMLLPRSTIEVVGTMLAQSKAPPDLLCTELIFLAAAVAFPGATEEEITTLMSTSGKNGTGKATKVRAVYVSPLELRSSFPKRSNKEFDEGSLCWASTTSREFDSLIDFDMEISKRRNLVKMDPPELRFPFESNLQISCSVEVSNITDDHIAFQFQCPRTKKFSFRPNQGMLLPRSTIEVIGTMQALSKAPPDMLCTELIFLAAVVTFLGATEEEITTIMSTSGRDGTAKAMKVQAVYISPLELRSSFPKRSNKEFDEGSLCWASTTSREFDSGFRRRRMLGP